MGDFHRRLREEKWPRADFPAAVRQFSHDDIGGFWTWLPLAGPNMEAAANTYTTLPDPVFLRAADCLHLITALHHNFGQIYTYDIPQARAATALGIQAAIVV